MQTAALPHSLIITSAAQRSTPMTEPTDIIFVMIIRSAATAKLMIQGIGNNTNMPPVATATHFPPLKPWKIGRRCPAIAPSTPRHIRSMRISVLTRPRCENSSPTRYPVSTENAPFAASNARQISPQRQPKVLRILVEPALPLPTLLISVPLDAAMRTAAILLPTR